DVCSSDLGGVVADDAIAADADPLGKHHIDHGHHPEGGLLPDLHPQEGAVHPVLQAEEGRVAGDVNHEGVFQHLPKRDGLVHLPEEIAPLDGKTFRSPHGHPPPDSAPISTMFTRSSIFSNTYSGERERSSSLPCQLQATAAASTPARRAANRSKRLSPTIRVRSGSAPTASIARRIGSGWGLGRPASP